MNTNDAYIGLSQIKRLSILGNLLKKVTPKEREEDASFHQIIDSSMTKINNFFASNLNFSSLVNYKRKSKKHGFLVKQKKSLLNIFGRDLRKKNSTNEIDEKNKSIEKENIKEKEKEKGKDNQKEIHLKKQRNFSLPQLTRNNSLVDKQLVIGLEEFNKMINSPTNNNKEENDGISANIPWFIKLDENNPIRKLLERKGNTERIKSRNSHGCKIKNGNLFYTKLDNQKRKAVSIDNKEYIKDFLTLLKEQTCAKPNYISSTNESSLKKINKLKKLLVKCDIEINRGNILDSFMEQNNAKLGEKYIEIKKYQKKLNENEERHYIEEPKTEKTKYHKMQEEILKNVKKRIQTQISEELAYKNRKEYKELIKNSNKDGVYELFLKDLTEINEEKEKTKIKERDNLRKIKMILDATSKGKEYLNNRIKEQQQIYNEIERYDKKNNYYPLFNDAFIKKNKNVNNKFVKFKTFDKISREVFSELEKKMSHN